MTREQLITHLHKISLNTKFWDEGKAVGVLVNWESVADFIIEEHKRIVEPLIKYKALDEMNLKNTRIQFCEEAINKTIELAGIEEGK